MSWIGLKTNRNSSGTGLADTLAKALLSDPTDVMNAAKTRSALETDEYQRRLIREDIALRTQQALAEGMKLRREQAAWNSRFDIMPGMEKLGVDAQTGLPAAAPAVEEPVPVVLESGGGGGVPEHLRNFDERHQPIMTAPPGYEPPVEVGELSMTNAPMGETTDSYLARRGVPSGLTETGRRGIPGAVGFPMPTLPPQLAGVPPELAQAPPPAGPVVGGVPDNPLVGGGKPLIDLRALLGGSDELPVPTLPEGYLTPPALLDEIPPRPASVTPEPVPAPYLPDPAPGMVPMEDLPLPVEEPAPEQALRQPAGTPFPATVDVAPTAAIEPPLPVGEEATPASVAEQAAASAAPPAAAPSPAPVNAPATTKITIKGVDDGKQDTAEVVQTANAGSMPREHINATIKYIMLNAANPAEGMQAVQRFVGTIGAMYNPDYGTDQRTTENLASLRGGGAAVGKESMAADLAAGEGPGGYEGTAIDVQDNNTITTLMDPAAPVTAAQARQYALAYTRQYRTPRIQRIEDENGNIVDKEIQPEVPAGTPSIAEIYARAGIGGEAPPPAPATTAPATAAPATAAPATAAPATAAPATAAPAVEGTPDGGYIVKRPHKDPTKEMTDTEQTRAAVTLGDQEINALTDADIPTPAEYLGSNPTKANASILREAINMTLRYKNPKLAKYWGAVMYFASPILRDESGAATRPEDMDIVLERYVPAPGDSPEVKERKALRRRAVAEGMKAGAFPGDTPRERLAAADAFIVKTLGEEALLDNKYKTGTTTAPAPSSGGTTSTRSPEDQKLYDKYRKKAPPSG